MSVRYYVTLAALLIVAACALHSGATAVAPAQFGTTGMLSPPCRSGQLLLVQNGSSEAIRVFGRRTGDPNAANGTETLGIVPPRTTDTLAVGSLANYSTIESISLDRPQEVNNAPRTPPGVSLACVAA